MSNKMFCEKKGSYRMAFKTRERAKFFIDNYEEIMEGEVELRPCRSFYCSSCDRWHITHFPLTPDKLRIEERDQKIHDLQTLVQRLRSEFRMSHWEAWKPIVAEAIETMDTFRLRPGFEKLAESTGASLDNYFKLIQTAQARADNSTNEDFMQMRKEIEKKAKSLDYEGFMQDSNKMILYFGYEKRRMSLSPANIEWLDQIRICLAVFSIEEDLLLVMDMANDSISDSRDVNAEDLYEQVMTLTLAMDRLLVAGLPRTLWDVLEAKAKKIGNVLEHSFGGVKVEGYESLSEKIRVHSIRKLLEETVRLIETGNKSEAIQVMEVIDKRMTKISLSLVKISLMETLCVLGKKVL